ncbi:MAG: hypothetical protein M3R60_12835, partial [Pseudomonadota bacterium]|nr:hypothetical protein [Pseudomonadota bacterium]
SAGNTSNVGAYPITQGSLGANPNYQLQFSGANLVVGARPLSVAATPQSKVYGDGDPVLAYSAAGLVNGDTLGGSLARAIGEGVGSYAIGQGSLAAGSNYAMAFVPNTLGVTPATLEVAANNQARNYGDANPALTYAASGFKFADTTGGVLTGSLATSAGSASNVGAYPITQGNLSANPNYALHFSGGSLAVKARPLSVAAAPATKVYGDADPVLAYAAGALVNGDALTGTLARNPGENAGSYGITQGSLTAGPNYAVGFTGNTLSVTPAMLTYVAAPASRAAGEVNPVFGGAVTGFRFGQSLADVSTTQPVFTSNADPASPPGRYPIDGDGVILSTSNYRLVQASGNAEALTVEGTRSAVMGNEDPAALAQDWAGAMGATSRSAQSVRLLAALTTSAAGVATTTASIMPVRTDPFGSVGGGAGEFGGLASADISVGSSGGQLPAQRSGTSAASAADIASTRVLPSCTYLYGRQ